MNEWKLLILEFSYAPYFLLISFKIATFLLLLSSNIGKVAKLWTLDLQPPDSNQDKSETLMYSRPVSEFPNKKTKEKHYLARITDMIARDIVYYCPWNSALFLLQEMSAISILN